MKRITPSSPFSTRLSGSAKETELRIRNIVQWKKKRPPVVLFVLTLVVLLSCFGLFSCQVKPLEVAVDNSPAAEVVKPAEIFGPNTEQDKGTFAEEGIQYGAEQTEDVITDYFSSKLSQLSPDTPLVITERQSFDWNGTTVIAATATNIVVADFEANLLRADGPHTEPNLPERENTVMYLMSALFIDGQEPIDLMLDAVCEISKTPLGQDTSGISYDYGEEASFQQFLSVIQYKSGKMLTTCPVFCNHGGELLIRDYKYRPVYSLEDADGDGEAEFVFFRDRSSSLYTKYVVYDWVNGTIQRTSDVLEQYRNPMLEENEPMRNEDALPLYREIMLGSGAFTLDGSVTALKDYFSYIGADGNTHYRRPGEFSVLDLDGDGRTEVVIAANDNQYALILREENGAVYGYVRYIRQFNTLTLKLDGTFNWSSGAFDNGTGRIRFEENIYTLGDRIIRESTVIDRITYCQSDGYDEEGNLKKYFYVDRQPATIPEYQAAEAQQEAKPDAVWYDFTEENINAQLDS